MILIVFDYCPLPSHWSVIIGLCCAQLCWPPSSFKQSFICIAFFYLDVNVRSTLAQTVMTVGTVYLATTICANQYLHLLAVSICLAFFAVLQMLQIWLIWLVPTLRRLPVGVCALFGHCNVLFSGNWLDLTAGAKWSARINKFSPLATLIWAEAIVSPLVSEWVECSQGSSDAVYGQYGTTRSICFMSTQLRIEINFN